MHVRLEEPSLPTLELTCGEGYVLDAFQISAPAERAVTAVRALADGQFDRTRFLGPRAITVSMVLDERVEGSMQRLTDNLAAFMSPRIRPTIIWSLPGTPFVERALTVRGTDWPFVVRGKKLQTIACSFVSEEAATRSVDPNELVLLPIPEVEEGREYDLEFDREYVPALPRGSATVNNAGNHVTAWRATIRASITNPILSFNGTPMRFDRNGGVALAVDQTLVIDSNTRTIRLNGDPNISRYDRVNFEDWEWDDLLLRPGDNLVRVQGSDIGPLASVTLEWYDRWL